MRVLCITEDLDRPTSALFVGLHAAGIDLRVSCPENSANRTLLAEAEIPLLDFNFSGRFDAEGTERLREELSNDYDILHLFSNKALQNGLVAAKGSGVRIVAYRGIVGNVSFFSPVSWMRVLNPRIDRIVCVAEAVRQYFLNMRPAFLRMPAERPVTIHKGHSLEWYTAEPAQLSEFGIPADAFSIACVANYRPRKGIEVLVDAIADLPVDCNAHLLLIGQMDSQQLTDAIQRAGVGDRVHRLGFREDAPSITAACDAFVLPSVKREGLARSLIEAMAYGVAPIVTDCGGSPELVLHEVCGLVVPVRSPQALRDAIVRLQRDPQLRARFGAAARQRIASDFRIETTIEKTLALYADLAAE